MSTVEAPSAARAVVIGTAGHIDHGKSALVRALTGVDPDRLKEERERGITIDLGFAHLDLDDVSLAFVDVPGHERFVKNMLAGAGGIDLVALVVAADESVMPQTREHFQICRLLQVPAGVIVLTKADLADADMREVARLDVRELVAGSFLADAPIVEVSSRTGAGMDKLRATLTAIVAGVRRRDEAGALRLPIDRVFSVKGFGTVVTGTLVSGELHVEQELQALPTGQRVKVRGLQMHGRGADRASAGRRVAVNLGGANVGDLDRGHTLVLAGTFEPTRRLDAVVDVLAGATALKHGTRVRFHYGTSEVLGRIAVAGPRDGRAGSATEIGAGESAYARIRLELPAVLTRGDRFIIRAYSPAVTIGGGVVLDPHPPRSAIRTASGRARFVHLGCVNPGASSDAALVRFVEERDTAGLDRRALVSRGGLAPAAAAAAEARLLASGRAVLAGDMLVAPAARASVEARLLAALKAHHAASPLSDGLPREEARERVFGRAAPALFDLVVNALVAKGAIAARDRLALAGHAVTLSDEEAKVYDTFARAYGEAGLAPPDAAGIGATIGASTKVVERVMSLLVRQKTLVKVDALYFHKDALARLKEDVRALKTTGAGQARVDVPGFKERYGISRKYAIPLLEYLDRERVTRRVGDVRVVL